MNRKNVAIFLVILFLGLPVTSGMARAATSDQVNAASNAIGGNSITFNPPTKDKTVKELLTTIVVALKNLVAPAAIVFIVVGGLMYMMSAGDETMIKRARACITAAVIGLAIVLAGPAFLKEIQTMLGGTVSAELSKELTIAQIAAKVLAFLLSILGIVAIISLVIGGLTLLTSYGSEKRAETAKTRITYSVLGIVVALAALIIVRQVVLLI